MSSNYLTPHGIDTRSGSDTLSEISENSQWDSREDLRDLVAKTGVQDASELHQDRFKVDRKKLEHMLLADNEAPEPADSFFHKVMEETHTYITWPSKLKIGAKSKKDPHVRIAGRFEDVQTARVRVMTVLDTRCNRVTMKMDVGYTDHSHIIGKGGLSIKRVMEETRCHVHFPDSNRSNEMEKSNQVSIAGDISGVEKARNRVRNLTPLIFGFELPIMASHRQIPHANTTYVIEIQLQYNVQVIFRTRSKLHATLVLVKGLEWEVRQVKRATMLLINYMCENLANQIAVQMMMEISPQHHPMVLGKNHENLKAIIKRTQTQIMFPDAEDPNIPSLKKSHVTIVGKIDNVYAARQQLMGSLPLVLMFDLPEDSEPLASDQIGNIQADLGVMISIRQKVKQNTLAYIIKGIERNASKIYEARNRVLGISEPAVIADIPKSYFTCLGIQVGDNGLPTISVQQPVSPIVSPIISPSWQFPTAHLGQPRGPYLGMLRQPQFVYNNNNTIIPGGSIGSSGHYSAGSSLSPEGSRDGASGPQSSISSISSFSSASPLSSPRNSSPVQRNADSPGGWEKTEHSSGFSDMSANSKHGDNNPVSYLASDVKSPFVTDIRSQYMGVSPFGCSDNSRFPFGFNDYEQKRLAGVSAMHTKLCTGEYRVPTNTWSGYGISHTSPTPLQMDSLSTSSDKDDDIWKTPTSKYGDFSYPSTSTMMNTSNILDHTPTQMINRITGTSWLDLPHMLTSLGLEKYIGQLTSHEIDLITFPSLTEQDLLLLGVNSFGARRKMMLAISEMNKRASPFPVAPGAERKSSSSTLSNQSSPEDSRW